MKKRIAIGIAALLYVLWPVDMLPDFLPLAGQVDDAIVGLSGALYAFWPLIRPVLEGMGFVKTKENAPK
ncbi:MAG: DUF1232 domain-containing protein [Candidatus Cloacimonetes bacterium]|nr:DUF1232 domain-containing protein [Candidatus Cloacimonadota bacterium]